MSEYSMPSYFQTMPVIGKEVAHFSEENAAQIQEVEQEIHEIREAGLTDEIVDMNDMRPYIQAFANACYQNPESICPFHQMLLPRVIRDYDNLNQKA